MNATASSATTHPSAYRGIQYQVKDFDLLNWHIEFWSDESRNLLDCIDLHVINTLRANDVGLTKTLGIDINDPEIPFLIRLARQRCDRLNFPATDPMCWLIAILANNNPGIAVMWCTALALAWQSSDTLHKEPNMAWFMSAYQEKQRFLGIPSAEHLERMWDNQKISGGNALDFVEVSA